MTDREKFLKRWSRKKREAASEAPGKTTEVAPSAPSAALDERDKSGAPPSPPPAPAPQFDLASLPSLDSIAADTDIRGFFAPGVPPELTRAALRRAWSADPAIRDFVGLQENDWDFNALNGVPGFGELPADIDIERLVAQVFGEAERDSEHAPPQPPTTSAPEAQGEAIREESASSTRPADFKLSSSAKLAATADERQAAAEQPQRDDLVQCEEDAALRNNAPNLSRKPVGRRQLGRALPK